MRCPPSRLCSSCSSTRPRARKPCARRGARERGRGFRRCARCRSRGVGFYRMAWELASFSADLLPAELEVEDVSVEVLPPGSPVRITHVLDAVEPRIRPAFPTDGRAGDGRTNRLDGVVVLSCLDFPGEERPLHEQESIVDLAGPGAAFTPFAEETCVVLTFQPGRAGNE